MRPHIEIRLAQLAKEIAASKAPKIDVMANIAFEMQGRSDGKKTAGDFPVKFKGAANGDAMVGVKPEVATPSQPKAAAAPIEVGDVLEYLPEYAMAIAMFGKTIEVTRLSQGPGYFWVHFIRPDGAEDFSFDGAFKPKLAPQKEETKPGADGWIECSSKPDFIGDVRIEVKRRNGALLECWSNTFNACWNLTFPTQLQLDIVAYRVLPS